MANGHDNGNGRVDWISRILQGASLAVFVAFAMLAWGGGRTDPQVAALQSQYASINSRLTEDEAANVRDTEQRASASSALSSKIDSMSTQLATLTAQVGDLQDIVKSFGHRLPPDPPTRGGP